MWWRIPAGAVINVAGWAALCTLMIIPVRLAWPEYATAEPARDYTLMMMVMRLSISAISSLAGAWLAGLTVRDNSMAPLAGGLLLLALFIPYHVGIWDKYPIWYHLTFFVSLPVLAWIGGRLAPSVD